MSGDREELAEVLHESMCCPDHEPEAVETFLGDADAVLASAVIGRLLAKAWDEGHEEGCVNPHGCPHLDENPYRDNPSKDGED